MPCSLHPSRQVSPRASIFRRDQGGVEGLEDMKRVMRYNDFANDPVGHCGRGAMGLWAVGRWDGGAVGRGPRRLRRACADDYTAVRYSTLWAGRERN